MRVEGNDRVHIERPGQARSALASVRGGGSRDRAFHAAASPRTRRTVLDLRSGRPRPAVLARRSRLQAYLLPRYDELLMLLKEVRPDSATSIPQSAAELAAGRDLETVMQRLRAEFRRDATLGRMLRERLRAAALPAAAEAGVARLVDLYTGADGRYVNFYGPPRTIRTIPYDAVVSRRARARPRRESRVRRLLRASAAGAARRVLFRLLAAHAARISAASSSAPPRSPTCSRQGRW